MDPNKYARLPGEMGRRIKSERLCKEPPLTQSQLAAEAEISESMLSRIEAGKQPPSFPVLYQIAEALDVEPTHLIPPRWCFQRPTTKRKRRK